MSEKRKKVLDFTSFGMSAPVIKSPPKKKEPKPTITFDDDPIDLRAALQEVADAIKSELVHLAKQYGLEAVSQDTVEEIRIALYAKIRAGGVKTLSAFETNHYVEWKYKCTCEDAKKALGKAYNIVLKLKEGRDPPEKECPYCHEMMTCK